MPILYLVATPIGNLKDITFRAIEVLKSVSFIASEDTRRTRILLSKYDINTRLISFHEHSDEQKIMQIIDLLEENDIAVVSDAGTPGLNDPGYQLVMKAVERGYTVSPIPGPSAPISALVTSGLPTDKFIYFGYVPRKKGKQASLFNEYSNQRLTMIFLESPRRLIKTLSNMQTYFPERKIAIARELTKLHEEIFRGTITEAVRHYEANPPRGEVTLILEGKNRGDSEWSMVDLKTRIQELRKESILTTVIAKKVAIESGWKKQDVYKVCLSLQEDEDTEEGQ